MRLKINKAFKRCILSVFAFLSILSGVSLPVHASSTGVIMVGDSRTVGMHTAVGDIEGYYWVAEIGKGLAWYDSTGYSQVQSIISAHSDVTEWKVVFNLGINDIEDGAKRYIDKYNTYLSSGHLKGCTFYFLSVNPVDEAKAREKNADIEKFNRELKEGVSGAIYIDSYTDLKPKIADACNGDSEGLHYSPSTYKEIFSKVQAGLNGGGTATAEGANTDKIPSGVLNGTPFNGTEDDIPGIAKEQDWGGEEVTLPDGSDLSSDDKIALSQWGEDIRNEKANKPTTLVRTGFAFVGILLIVYSMFLYVAYWLDKVGDILQFSALKLLTGGILSISPDDCSSTFHRQDKGIKTVIHRDIVYIVFVGITAGVLILTGKLYWLIIELIRWMQGI